MDVTAAPAATPPREQSAAEESSNTAAATLAADFENFLTLLTTQLQAQDPLSPVESTEFVQQLASFSSVEQQIQTNEKLDAIASALGQGDLNSVAQWVGQSVETRADNVRFNGQEIAFSTADASSFDSVVASIRDANGETVGRVPLDKTETDHIWRGEDGAGGRVLNGDYTIELEYLRGDSVVRTETASQTGTVEEARLTADGWRLKLSSGAIIDPAGITAILPIEDA